MAACRPQRMRGLGYSPPHRDARTGAARTSGAAQRSAAYAPTCRATLGGRQPVYNSKSPTRHTRSLGRLLHNLADWTSHVQCPLLLYFTGARHGSRARRGGSWGVACCQWAGIHATKYKSIPKKITQSYSCARVSQGLDACGASAKQLGARVRIGAKTGMKREPPSTASPSKKIPCAPHHAGALMVQPSGCTLCAAHPFTWHLYGTSLVVPCPHKRPGHRSFRRAKQATAAAPV